MTHECVFIDAVRMANARAHKEKGERYGLATLCGGFGNANAVLVDKIAGTPDSTPVATGRSQRVRRARSGEERERK